MYVYMYVTVQAHMHMCACTRTVPLSIMSSFHSTHTRVHTSTHISLGQGYLNGWNDLVVTIGDTLHIGELDDDVMVVALRTRNRNTTVT